MRSVFVPFATIALAVAPTQTGAQTGAQADALTAVSNHLKAVATMTANFSQTDRSGKTVTGALSLKRPGKIRFQYEKGVPILIVGNGRTLTFIDYSVRQVQSWPIGSTPLGVLLNPNKDLRGVARIRFAWYGKMRGETRRGKARYVEPLRAQNVGSAE